MSTVRIALANLPYPKTPEDAVARVEEAIAAAGKEAAEVICFPEAYLPGYRGLGYNPPPPEAAFLERAWSTVQGAAKRANVAVVLGTERLAGTKLLISALVVGRDGRVLGFQDKVQLDPSEDGFYTPSAGTERHVFESGPLKFGVVICHEGWRYPETVRQAARKGAQLIFHPHFHPGEPNTHHPTAFAEPASTFHEKAALCRAAENTCYFATINYASEGSQTTSAFIRPDGTLLKYQPYGQSGLLCADLDLSPATGLLASRCRS